LQVVSAKAGGVLVNPLQSPRVFGGDVFFDFGRVVPRDKSQIFRKPCFLGDRAFLSC
jgi:hypothetical protein